MNRTINLPANDALADYARRAFPEYKGKKFKLELHETPGMRLESNWDGSGSRDYFKIVRSDGATMAVRQNGTMFDRPLTEIPSDQLPNSQFRVVEHTIFLGKDLGLTVHMLASDFNMQALPSVELTPIERKVLEITRSVISSYRDDERRRQCISRAEWDEAKARLIERKLLAKSGAITVDGRNAIA